MPMQEASDGLKREDGNIVVSSSVFSYRRQVLLGLGSILISGVTSLHRSAPDASPGLWADRKALIVGLLPAAVFTWSMGQLYLTKFPHERDRELLWHLLFEKAELNGVHEGRALMDERIETDFQACNVLILDGWVVARSEARLCALRSLD